MSIFRVQQMHDKFGFKALDKPGFLPDDLMRMRLDFMLEELKETAEACGFELGENPYAHTEKTRYSFVRNKLPDHRRSLGDALDGMLDLEVVNEGTAHLMGFGHHVPDGIRSRYATIWTEGQDRVFAANMAKRRCAPGEVGKRGSSHDLIKPEGWKAPTYGDLLP